jgi:transposase
MTVRIAELPDSIEELKEIIRLQATHIEMQTTQIKEITNKLVWAEEKYRAMAARYFGRKSEKYTAEEDRQNRLFDEAELHASEQAPPVREKIVVASHERKRGGRKAKTAVFPSVEQIHELDESDRRCGCCGAERPVIGEERTSEYDLVPEHIVKIVHVRKKYGPCSCENCRREGREGIDIAPGPVKIIPGSDFTNRTIAFFITGKYADAIPFYRMEKTLSRFGMVISRATLSNQAIGIGRAIGGLVELMDRDLAASPVLLMDETTVQVLKEGTGSPRKKSYMWVTRGYRKRKPIHRFVYHASRSGTFAEELLKKFMGGHVQTDGFDGYNRLDYREGIVHVGCFAHIRRKFVTAWEAAGKTGIAKIPIDHIAKLYKIESELRAGLDSDELTEERFLERRKEAVIPVFEQFRQWLMESSLSVAPQSLLGKAIAYAQAMYSRAVRYIEHPLLTPDTNAVENAIRPFVIGRKNWLFSGSPLGAHASAGIYSLIETAKANGHDPYHYLCYVFDRLPLCVSQSEQEALLPYNIDPDTIMQM